MGEPCPRPGRSRRGPRYVTAAAVAVLALSGVVAPATATWADPSPAKLRAKVNKLADRAEQVTEQYNGKRLGLRRARRAAGAANRTARSKQREVRRVRSKVAALAASRYIGGADPDLTVLADTDPQRALDASVLGRHLSGRDTALLRELGSAQTRLDAARRTADRHVSDIKKITGDLGAKKRRLEKLIAALRRELPSTGATPDPGTAPHITGSGTAARAARAALSQLGTPYSWGGGTASGPSYGIAQGANIKGYDCSGLTLYAYAQAGITLPHYTGAQFQRGRHVSESELKPGDLVFFYSDLRHEGMYIGHGEMINAPQTGDVVKIAPIAGRPFAGAVRLAG